MSNFVIFAWVGGFESFGNGANIDRSVVSASGSGLEVCAGEAFAFESVEFDGESEVAAVVVVVVVVIAVLVGSDELAVVGIVEGVRKVSSSLRFFAIFLTPDI